MGRILRVEPFCFARKAVSPMVTYSLPSFFGRTTDVWKNGGTEPLSTAAAAGRQSAHSLRYLCSTSIARITDQSALTDGLRLAGSRQRFRPGEAKLHGAISESADEPQTLLRDRGIADGHTILFPYRWKIVGRNHNQAPADVGKVWTLLSLPVQYKYCTGNCQSVHTFAYIGWWLAKVPSIESQIA